MALPVGAADTKEKAHARIARPKPLVNTLSMGLGFTGGDKDNFLNFPSFRE